MKNVGHEALLIPVIILFSIFISTTGQGNIVFAQTSGSRTIIVQTDLEEPINNQTIICKQLPKKIDSVLESEIALHEIVTNDSGEASLTVIDPENSIFSCTSKEVATTDYCWYFPSPTVFFDIYEETEKNKPVYLVGQKSPETCGKTFTETELQNGIANLLPSGTPMPFQNKNLTPPTPNLPPSATTQISVEENKELTLWQWIVLKIKSLF